MIKKDRGYALRRPFYKVDPNAQINAGMVAFLADLAGEVVATTAASGTVPIGTFWKNHNTVYTKTLLEQGAFDSNDEIQLLHGGLLGAGHVKVTDLSGVAYVFGADWTVNLVNGIIVRDSGGSIASAETVLVWYEYSLTAAQMAFNGGVNYDRAPDDTIGSSKISVVEGWAHIFTDQFDVAQAYVLNASLRSNVSSQWTTEVTAYPICGKVIQVPTVDFPFLGVQQTTVLV